MRKILFKVNSASNALALNIFWGVKNEVVPICISLSFFFKFIIATNETGTRRILHAVSTVLWLWCSRAAAPIWLCWTKKEGCLRSRLVGPHVKHQSLNVLAYSHFLKNTFLKYETLEFTAQVFFIHWDASTHFNSLACLYWWNWSRPINRRREPSPIFDHQFVCIFPANNIQRLSYSNIPCIFDQICEINIPFSSELRCSYDATL